MLRVKEFPLGPNDDAGIRRKLPDDIVPEEFMESGMESGMDSGMESGME